MGENDTQRFQLETWFFFLGLSLRRYSWEAELRELIAVLHDAGIKPMVERDWAA